MIGIMRLGIAIPCIVVGCGSSSRPVGVARMIMTSTARHRGRTDRSREDYAR